MVTKGMVTKGTVTTGMVTEGGSGFSPLCKHMLQGIATAGAVTKRWLLREW